MSGPETTQWEIRPGTEADVQALLELWRLGGPRPSVTDSEAGIRTLLGHDPGSLLLADADGTLVGSLVVGWDGWRGSFYRLAVDPGRRRQGIATALVRTGEASLRARGAVRLTAIAVTDENAANALWEALGYELQTDVGRFVRVLDA